MSADHPGIAPVAAALLAGGRSSRMRSDKALLDWRGTRLWKVQLGKLMELNPARVLLSRRADQEFKTLLADHVIDPPDNPGPLGAITRCLEAGKEPLLVLAIDMPHMTYAFLASMIESCVDGSAGMVCRSQDGLEPLCAIYPPGALPLLRAALDERCFRMRTVAQRLVDAGLLRVRDLMPDEVPLFFNANTPEEYAWTKPAPPASK
jgi:molybdopterin-guanine dinucleotide biosynthesis protein A